MRYQFISNAQNLTIQDIYDIIPWCNAVIRIHTGLIAFENRHDAENYLSLKAINELELV